MRLLEMSISAGVLILLVAFFGRSRFFKLSKRAVMLLWMVVLARLLLPGSLPMQKGIAAPVFGLLRRMHSLRPALTEPAGSTGSAGAAPQAPSFGQAGLIGGDLLQAAGWAWLAGMCSVFVYFMYSYWKEYQLLSQALVLESAAMPVCEQDGRGDAGRQKAAQIRECCRTACRLAGIRPRGKAVRILVHDQIHSPLVFGIIRQSIVIPKGLLFLEQTQMQHILTHEMVHIRRCDNLWKLFSAAAVCIHWFNPAVWLMYLLFGRDLELSCDEQVLAAYGSKGRQEYAMTLLTLAENQKGTTLFCSGFFENPVKERIVAIMKYKKLTGIGILCAGMLIMGATSVFATNGQAAEIKADQANESLLEADDGETNAEKDGTAKIKSADPDSILVEVNPEHADSDPKEVRVTFRQPVHSETEVGEGKIYNYSVDDQGNYVLKELEDGKTYEIREGEFQESDDKEAVYSTQMNVETDAPDSIELVEGTGEPANAQALYDADMTESAGIPD